MVKKIGVIYKKNTLLALKVVDQFYNYLKNNGVELYLDMDGKVNGDMDGVYYIPEKEMANIVDIIVVMGGDGTFLHASHLVHNQDIPILGINLGSLGFLTEVQLEEIYEAIDTILDESYNIVSRQRLKICVDTDGECRTYRDVLNDISINSGKVARIIDIDLFMGDEYITSYRADGLIVSTPTGSTAYSLSAGGPIIYPTVDVMIVTPICPHTLTMRPLVLPGDSKLKIYIKSDREDIHLTLDGQQSIQITEKVDCIKVETSDYKIKTIKAVKRGYFEILRKKLKWSGSPLK